jgi:transcriptional regulator with XRE-family HTH domain
MNMIRHYRTKNGLTQKEVASHLLICQTQYHRLETGKSLLNAKQIIKLCHLFGCTPNDLLGFRGVHTVVAGKLDQEI